ncbi:triacylglycerol lipase [Angustibacter sp. Root456]|uniref:esterase/lipase family protein n=1 Tax=Angustibacter sp. Root456 TaxID=1736539 RepID=UPI00190FFB26|nr:alpha/beta fold hydrolase [Angustibacter sp. Root456]
MNAAAALAAAPQVAHTAARTATRAVGRGARAVLSPSGVRGAALEAAWLTTHLATYPLGLLDPLGLLGPMGREHEHRPYGVGHRSPVQRGLLVGDVEAAGTPILLVHGMVDNRSIFTVLRRALRRRGFGHVHSINYSPLTGDVRAAARDLARHVEGLAADTGSEQVHVVGHSLGGLIARYYVQRLGGHHRVHTLVTLGTPHAGTLPAYLLPARLCRQLRPGSALMRELAEPAPDCTTRFEAYWSDLDQLIVPQRNARLVHADLDVVSHLVRGIGHTSLPVDSRVVHGICSTLAHLRREGGHGGAPEPRLAG